MFACIYCRSVSESGLADTGNGAALVGLAFTFSPLVEQTNADTVVLDISGQRLLFGRTPSAETWEADDEALRKIAKAIAQRGQELKLKINVAVGANPDLAIHVARAFKGVTVINVREEVSKLENLSIKRLDYSLAAIEAKRATEIQETFLLWGVRTFGDLARLPLSGVAERLGQDGVRLQKLAQGKSDRQLKLMRPPIGFAQSLDLEHPITELEPLSFILSRLLNQLCANLHEYALATNELRLRLVSEPGAVATGSSDTSDVISESERIVTLPIPMRNPKTLLRLLLFEIEREPPQAPIVSVAISAQPVKPRASQTGLFIPLAPEPEKLEITLARLAKLVGTENVGSPEIVDTHRPDAFRMKRFRSEARGRRSKVRRKANPQFAINDRQCVMGLRIFRPPWRAEVQLRHGQPRRINARGAQTSVGIRGDVIQAAGPWRASGDWWRSDVWARDEWDVAVADATSPESEVVCRIYRDLTNERWFVEGIYD